MKNKKVLLLIAIFICIGITVFSLYNIFSNFNVKGNNEDNYIEDNGDNYAEDNGDNYAEDNGDDYAEGEIISTSHSSFAYYSAEELKAEADIILIAEYTGVSTETAVDKSYVDVVTSEIYTDYQFKPLTVAKGTASDIVNVRFAGDKITSTKNSPQFKKGEKYFMYLRRGRKVSENDIENYFPVVDKSDCYLIDENGNINISDRQQEDTQKIQIIYDSIKGNG